MFSITFVCYIQTYFFWSASSAKPSISASGFNWPDRFSKRRILFSSFFFFLSSLALIIAGSNRFLFLSGSPLQDTRLL